MTRFSFFGSWGFPRTSPDDRLDGPGGRLSLPICCMSPDDRGRGLPRAPRVGETVGETAAASRPAQHGTTHSTAPTQHGTHAARAHTARARHTASAPHTAHAPTRTGKHTHTHTHTCADKLLLEQLQKYSDTKDPHFTKDREEALATALQARPPAASSSFASCRGQGGEWVRNLSAGDWDAWGAVVTEWDVWSAWADSAAARAADINDIYDSWLALFEQ